MDNQQNITVAHVEQMTRLLETLHDDPLLLMQFDEALRIRLLKAAGLLVRPDQGVLKQRQKSARRHQRMREIAEERHLTAQTGIRSARTDSVFKAPSVENLVTGTCIGTLDRDRHCYICNAAYRDIHHFYDALCPSCATLNYQKRFAQADLTGMVALVTGARLKIGYQTALNMLRSGAIVIAVTRFPVDAAMRYGAEDDFDQWKGHLHVYGLDLRHIPSLERFCDHVTSSFGRLDILINNAAQTVRRPPGFYAHLMSNELHDLGELQSDLSGLLARYKVLLENLRLESCPNTPSKLPTNWQHNSKAMGLQMPAALSQIPYTLEDPAPEANFFPTGQLDADLQQVDLRPSNSWRLKLGEIDAAEMLEVQLVNAVAPFVLCNRLIPLMKLENTGCKHIVNVTAMEGKFYRFRKSERHPHTNMAKAALNMMTHTAASELANHGIYINAVDTGWVTDEDPVQLVSQKQHTQDFQPPLDIVDGAARICDPFVDGINSGQHWCGKFLKDYFPIDW